MHLLKEGQLKHEINKQNIQQYTNTTFYDFKTFKDVLKLAFKCKNKKTIDKILKNWSKEVRSEIDWGRKTKVIDKTEEYQVHSLHPNELIMIINIGKVLQEKHKMTAELAFILSFGLVHAHFVFEDTAMHLTVEGIYNTLPKTFQTKKGKKEFKKDFFIKGTSTEIRKILFENI